MVHTASFSYLRTLFDEYNDDFIKSSSPEVICSALVKAVEVLQQNNFVKTLKNDFDKDMLDKLNSYDIPKPTKILKAAKENQGQEKKQKASKKFLGQLLNKYSEKFFERLNAKSSHDKLKQIVACIEKTWNFKSDRLQQF